jgi:hypothetical protein
MPRPRPLHWLIRRAAMLQRAPARGKPYFAVNEATCAQGCASAHSITSREPV